MTFQQKLDSNRQRLGVPEPQQLASFPIPADKVAAILTSSIALIDAVEHLNRHSLEVELHAIKQLANEVEQAITQAVPTTR